MFGDDPDPTVTTARFGFGEVSEAREGDGAKCREGRWFDKRETKHGWTEISQRRQGGNAATMNGCKCYENMRMQCT